MNIKTVCRCCTAGCGIIVEVQDNEVKRISGDKDHPESHGYVCPKGHGLAAFHNSPKRLDYPRIRGEIVSWDRMITHLSSQFASLINTYGGNSIAMYTGTGQFADFLGKQTLSRLLTEIGSSQKYSPITVDAAPTLRVAEIITGSNRLLPMWVPEDTHSQFVLWIGGNPLVSHGYTNRLTDPLRRIKNFQDRGGQLWIVDPRRTKTARLASRHLQPRPGSDLALMGWLAKKILEGGKVSDDFLNSTDRQARSQFADALRPFTLSYVLHSTGLARSEINSLLAEIQASAKIAIVIGTGVTFDRHAILTDWLRWTILLMKGSLDQHGGMYFFPGWLDPLDAEGTIVTRPSPSTAGPSSRPQLRTIFGEIPCVAFADEIENGTLRAAVITGGSPETAFPDPARVKRVLCSLQTLVVADVVETPLTSIATHVLPVTGQLERTDLLHIRLSRAMIAKSVIGPQGERRPFWWIFARVAQRLGIDVLDGLDPETVSEEELIERLASGGRGDGAELMRAGSYGLEIPLRTEWVREHLAERSWNILPPELIIRLRTVFRERDNTAASQDNTAASQFIFIAGRQGDRVNGTHYSSVHRSRENASFHINPLDAARLEVTDGQEVEVSNSSGRLIGTVTIDADVRAGSVYAPHGWYERNVGHLTSDGDDVDPLTGQPVMSSFIIQVRKTQCSLFKFARPSEVRGWDVGRPGEF